MSLKRYSSGTWTDINDLKRYDGGAWTDCTDVKRYENGSWISVWESYESKSFKYNESKIGSDRPSAQNIITTGSNRITGLVRSTNSITGYIWISYRLQFRDDGESINCYRLACNITLNGQVIGTNSSGQKLYSTGCIEFTCEFDDGTSNSYITKGEISIGQSTWIANSNLNLFARFNNPNPYKSAKAIIFKIATNPFISFANGIPLEFDINNIIVDNSKKYKFEPHVFRIY